MKQFKRIQISIISSHIKKVNYINQTISNMENQESPLHLLNCKFNLNRSLIRAMVEALRKRNTSWSWVELDQENHVQEYYETVCTQYVTEFSTIHVKGPTWKLLHNEWGGIFGGWRCY